MHTELSIDVVWRGASHLLPALLVQQLAQVVQAAGDGALVGVRVLQVLVGDLGAGGEGELGLRQTALVHQHDARVQVRRCCGETGERERSGWVVLVVVLV